MSNDSVFNAIVFLIGVFINVQVMGSIY